MAADKVSCLMVPCLDGMEIYLRYQHVSCGLFFHATHPISWTQVPPHQCHLSCSIHTGRNLHWMLFSTIKYIKGYNVDSVANLATPSLDLASSQTTLEDCQNFFCSSGECWRWYQNSGYVAWKHVTYFIPYFMSLTSSSRSSWWPVSLDSSVAVLAAATGDPQHSRKELWVHKTQSFDYILHSYILQ